MNTLPNQMHRLGGTVGGARVRVDWSSGTSAMSKMSKHAYTGSFPTTFPTSECVPTAHPARPLGAST